jgi:hypothetical protein
VPAFLRRAQHHDRPAEQGNPAGRKQSGGANRLRFGGHEAKQRRLRFDQQRQAERQTDQSAGITESPADA